MLAEPNQAACLGARLSVQPLLNEKIHKKENNIQKLNFKIEKLKT